MREDKRTDDVATALVVFDLVMMCHALTSPAKYFLRDLSDHVYNDGF